MPRPSRTVKVVLTPEEQAIRDRHAPKIGTEAEPHCGHCDQPKPLSTWGKYAGVYCDDCSGAVAYERVTARRKS